MSSVVVLEHLTLDGIMQAPGRSDEDRRGGFRHGGWAQPRTDDVMGRVLGEQMARTGALLLGRRTFEDFAGYWPRQEGNPFREALAGIRKYVASTTLREPLGWSNSVLLTGDAGDAVAELRRQPGPDLVVMGSGELSGSLLRRGLVDEYLLMIHPLVLGSGRRLFPDDGLPAEFRLTDGTTTSTGVLLARYRTGS